MKDNNKVWYAKGFKQGYMEGQKPMINLADGSATIRSDNFAFIAGRLSKDKEIEDAIAEIDKEIDAYRDGGSGNELVIFGLIQAKAIIEEHTGIGEQEEYK